MSEYLKKVYLNPDGRTKAVVYASVPTNYSKSEIIRCVVNGKRCTVETSVRYLSPEERSSFNKISEEAFLRIHALCVKYDIARKSADRIVIDMLK